MIHLSETLILGDEVRLIFGLTGREYLRAVDVGSLSTSWVSQPLGRPSGTGHNAMDVIQFHLSVLHLGQKDALQYFDEDAFELVDAFALHYSQADIGNPVQTNALVLRFFSEALGAQDAADVLELVLRCNSLVCGGIVRFLATQAHISEAV